MRPSPSITRRWAGPARLGGASPAPGWDEAAEGTWGRAGRTGVPAPQRPEGSPRTNVKGKMERDNLFHGQVREEGLEEPELPEPRQQRSWAPSSPPLPIPSRQPWPPTWAK